MKRNSIFMWAYITFVFMAIIMRLCFDYPLWTPLVLAVTISSVLFAVEDLFASLAKTLSDTCDNIENFVSIARGKMEKALSSIENELASLEKVLVFLEETSAALEKTSKSANDIENLVHKVSGTKKTTEKNKVRLTGMIQNLSDIEQKAINDRRLQKRYSEYANFLAYLGFLILFFVLILAPFTTISTATQDEFTVFSFFVILITRQISIDKSMKIKDDMLTFQNFVQSQEELEADISDIEKIYNSIIELIEIPMNHSEEVSSHAN